MALVYQHVGKTMGSLLKQLGPKLLENMCKHTSVNLFTKIFHH